MKRVLAALAFAATMASAPALSQEGGAPLQVQPGQQYTVRIAEEQTILSGGQEVTTRVGAVYALDILAADRWRYTPVHVSYDSFDGLGVDLEALTGVDFALMSEGLSALLRASADIGFECRVDAVGRCVEWSNWPQWAARAENAVIAVDAFARMASAMSDAAAGPGGAPKASGGRDAAAAQDSGSDAPDVDWNAIRGPVLQGVSALIDGVDAQSASTLMSVFHPAAAVQGRVARRGETQSFVEEWPVPFGAAPVTVTGALVLESVDRRANTATFVRTAQLDEASARASLQGVSDYVIQRVVQPMAPLMGEDGAATPAMLSALVTGFLPQMGFGFEETTRGVVDLNTGLARETVTDYVVRVSFSDPAMAAQGFEARSRYTMHIEPGAPPAPRLPRAQ